MAVKISRSFLHVSLILTFVFPLQGEIFLPSFGNTTFVNEGSDVEIPWTYNFEGREVAFATWTFINNTVEEQLALLSLETNRLTTSTIFPNINVTGQATLVLKNVNRYYNGTYRLTITVRSGSPPRPSYVMVIVKESVSLSTGRISSSFPTTESEMTTPTSTPTGSISSSFPATESEMITPTSTPTVVCDTCETEWYIVVVSLLSGFIFGSLVTFGATYCLKLRNKKDPLTVVPRTSEVTKTYEELDLSKMNSEENYQSLRRNSAARNNTELIKI